MKRKITERLAAWKNKRDRMPLILDGARQVGKTYSALEFGKSGYASTAYFNFESSAELGRIFERELVPDKIIRDLEIFSLQKITPEQTLVIFDEIQCSERALTSLKYFCEQAPQYHIIAAGSLLGVALNRNAYSFPVGKTERLEMRPMDFEEFLWALGMDGLAEAIRESFASFSPLAAHERALEFFKKYIVVGGMPKAVSEYAAHEDFNYVTPVQKSLANDYVADMAKYATPQETARIIAAWNSVPAQLAKENHKFQYKLIKHGARSSEYENAITWLETSGIILKCIRAAQGELPLSAYADASAFKIYLADTGLLCSKFEIPPNVVMETPLSFNQFKGALAENCAMQALAANSVKPYYWAQDNRYEVDFIFQNERGDIIPLEIKSSEHTTSKSLSVYTSKYKPPYAFRASQKNFGFENGIKSIPLYALFCLDGRAQHT